MASGKPLIFDGMAKRLGKRGDSRSVLWIQAILRQCYFKAGLCTVLNL